MMGDNEPTGAKRWPKLTSKDLPFRMTEEVATEIDELVAAIKRRDPLTDCYMDELHGSARDVSADAEIWIHRYYLQGYWKLWDDEGNWHFPER